jgi:putative phosphoesterase
MINMKWLIASDLHGSARYTRELLAAFDREQADRLLLLGDILYHGPRNDLPEEYAPKQVIALLTERKDRILCVRGNCDTEVDQMVLPFPILADYAILPVGNRLMYCTHGHHFNVNALPPMQKGDILIYGHTHVPLLDVNEDRVCLNPGSVSIPKENSWHGCMTLEDGHFRWIDFDGNVQMEWDAN